MQCEATDLPFDAGTVGDSADGGGSRTTCSFATGGTTAAGGFMPINCLATGGEAVGAGREGGGSGIDGGGVTVGKAGGGI